MKTEEGEGVSNNRKERSVISMESKLSISASPGVLCTVMRLTQKRTSDVTRSFVIQCICKWLADEMGFNFKLKFLTEAIV